MRLSDVLQQQHTLHEQQASKIAACPIDRAALFLDALDRAPARLATVGLFWPGDGDGQSTPNGIYDLAMRHLDLATVEAALEKADPADIGDPAWHLANTYALAAYALGVAVGYVFAAGSAPASGRP